jgi:uncharacterized protein (TIRG00374 family)
MSAASRPANRRHLSVALIVVFALLGTLVALLDARKAWALLQRAEWQLLPAALALTAASYFCLSAGYSSINRLFGIQLKWRDLLEIGFVSFALNNLVSVAGVAGYSLRLLLLRRRGLATGDVLGASLVHSYFNHLVMMALLPAGLVYLLVNHPLGRTQTAELWTALGLVMVVLAATTLLLASARVRGGAVRVLAPPARRILRRDVEPGLRDLDATLGRGLAAIRARPAVLGVPLLLVLADWLTSVLTLGVCFDALGDPLHFGILLTGFSIGVTAGLLSMLPGGLGVQEGSMTGVYVLLGVDLEHAVLAAMLFRIVYYIVPFALSLSLYARILRRSGPLLPDASASAP